MRKLFFYLALLTGIPAMSDNLYVEDFVVPPGGNISVPIRYQFETGGLYGGYQFEITLPDGITAVLDVDGNPTFTTGNGLDGGFLSFSGLNSESGNSLFCGFSEDGKYIRNTEGTLITLYLTANSTLENGTKLTGKVSKAAFGSIDGETTVEVDDVEFNITISKSEYISGDLSITDVVMIIDVIAGTITDANQVAAADVNDDGNVTISDCVAAIDLIAVQQFNGLRRAKNLANNMDFISASLKDNMLTVDFDNENRYAAFQMIVTMSEDMTIDRAQMDETRGAGHQIVVRNLGNGQYLLAGFSTDNDELTGNSGRLLTIITNGQLSGDILISDVEFATTTYEAAHLRSVSVSGTTTGIEDIKNGKSETETAIYDLQGRRVAKPTKGLYIYNGKKVNRK